MYITGGGNATFEKCVARNNRAKSGGFLHAFNADVHLEDMLLRQNSATARGGAVSFIVSAGTTPVATLLVKNTVAEMNSAINGSAIYSKRGRVLESCGNIESSAFFRVLGSYDFAVSSDCPGPSSVPTSLPSPAPTGMPTLYPAPVPTAGASLKLSYCPPLYMTPDRVAAYMEDVLCIRHQQHGSLPSTLCGYLDTLRETAFPSDLCTYDAKETPFKPTGTPTPGPSISMKPTTP